jgi:hypothetical protein
LQPGQALATVAHTSLFGGGTCLVATATQQRRSRPAHCQGQ